MKNKKLLTVTVGIPAYNEERNIAYLLHSILKQKQKTYKLEKIIVVCDGTDNTASIVKDFSRRYKNIKLIHRSQRRGKAKALNEIYQLNTSDIIITLDGDIILSTPKTLETLLRGFENKKVVVVGGNNQPVRAETFIERVYNAGYRMWYEIRKDYRDGHNINNFHGMTVGLKKSFAKSFTVPKTVADGDAFVCIMAKMQKKHFWFVKDAVVLFRSVNNLNDFFIQASRNLDLKHNLAKELGDQVYKDYKIATMYKIKGVLKMLYADPFYTFLSIVLQIWIHVFPARKRMSHKQGVWQIAKSTKKGIKVEQKQVK